MKITTVNNSYLIYSIYQNRIDLDYIQSNYKGDGTKLINELKNIAINKQLPIELYSEPQDQTISQTNLNAFYEKNGFQLHPEDIDFSFYVWGNIKKVY